MSKHNTYGIKESYEVSLGVLSNVINTSIGALLQLINLNDRDTTRKRLHALWYLNSNANRLIPDGKPLNELSPCFSLDIIDHCTNACKTDILQDSMPSAIKFLIDYNWNIGNDRYTWIRYKKWDYQLPLDLSILDEYGSYAYDIVDETESVVMCLNILSAKDSAYVRDTLKMAYWISIHNGDGMSIEFGIKDPSNVRKVFMDEQTSICCKCDYCKNRPHDEYTFLKPLSGDVCDLLKNGFDFRSALYSLSEALQEFKVMQSRCTEIFTSHGCKVIDASYTPGSIIINLSAILTGVENKVGRFRLKTSYGDIIFKYNSLEGFIDDAIKDMGIIDLYSIDITKKYPNFLELTKEEQDKIILDILGIEKDGTPKKRVVEKKDKQSKTCKRKAPITIVKERLADTEVKLHDANEEIESLKNSIEHYKNEISQLKTDLHNVKDIKSYHTCLPSTANESKDIDEYYDGELQDAIRSTITYWLKKQGNEPSRARNLLEEYLNNTSDTKYKHDFKDNLMKVLLMTNNNSMSKQLMESLGFTYRGNTGHDKYCYHGDPNLHFTVACTPSDVKHAENTAKTIIHRVFGV